MATLLRPISVSTTTTTTTSDTRLKLEGTTQTFGQLLQRQITPTALDTISTITSTTIPAASTPAATINDRMGTTDNTQTEVTSYSRVLQEIQDDPNTHVLNPIVTAAIENGTITIPDSSGRSVFDVFTSKFKTPLEQLNSLNEAQKVNLLVTIGSKESVEIEANTLEVPDVEMTLNYQFFEPSESIISEQEDASKDPLNGSSIVDVPRYIQLSWDPIEINEILESQKDLTTEEQRMVNDTFKQQRINVNGAVDNKRLSPVSVGGRQVLLKDIQQLDKAMDYSANKNVFVNTIPVSLNISEADERRLNLSDIILQDD